jgi:hypothetical protein
VESEDDLTFSPIFDKKMSTTLQVYCKSIWSDVHSLLQPDGESTDLVGPFFFFGWLGFL